MSDTPTINDSDENLATILQEANQEALKILYDRYAPALFGILQKITGDYDTAEEALQASFVNVWQNKNLYNSSKERLFTWMFKIAKNTANAVLEKKEKQKNRSSQLYVSDENPRYKNSSLLIELLIFRDISQEEASEKMGISIMALRQIIRKEINKIRGI